MKRFLLVLVVASVVAIATVPKASAALPGECGKSYAGPRITVYDALTIPLTGL